MTGVTQGQNLALRNFPPEKTETVYFCGCKKTSNKPFCDGSHKKLETAIAPNQSFSASVQPDDIKIDIAEDESILIASLRNNITHLSACGGTGKCSTCRIEILEGMENCFPRNDLEQKLAAKTFVPR
ncbi:MAG: CDGSH iron-sulfur domain-containing protein [Paracoccaceae bacterium]